MRIGIEAQALGKGDDGRLDRPARDVYPIANGGHDAFVPRQEHGWQLPPGVARRVVGLERTKRRQIIVVLHLAAAVMRIELITPPGDLVSSETYNKLFTIHGVLMVWFFRSFQSWKNRDPVATAPGSDFVAALI